MAAVGRFGVGLRRGLRWFSVSFRRGCRVVCCVVCRVGVAWFAASFRRGCCVVLRAWVWRGLLLFNDTHADDDNAFFIYKRKLLTPSYRVLATMKAG